MKLDLICNKQDEFYTPEYAIIPLLKYLKPNSKIWCPFDTDKSNFVKLLKNEGHTVTHTHIEQGYDFFTVDNNKCQVFDYIISNPPYSVKGKVFNKLFEINKPFAMLVGIVGLFESKERFDMFKNNTFEIMYLDKRVSYFKDYDEPKPSLNPPFSSVYLTSNILPSQIVFENINKKYEI